MSATPPQRISEDITELDLAWFAGILDGEGHLGVTQATDRPGYRVNLQVGMTHEPTLIHIQAKMGGAIYKPPKYETSSQWWSWRAGQLKHMQQILTRCMPYLVTKREKAVCVLAVVENKLSEHPSLEWQAALVERMKLT